MSDVTALFLSNWVLLICVAIFDGMFDITKIGKPSLLKLILGLWAVLSIASVPAWVLYLLWS